MDSKKTANQTDKPQKILVFQQNGSGESKIAGIRKYGENRIVLEVITIDDLVRLMWFTPNGSKFAVMLQANQKLCTLGLGQGMRKREKKEGGKRRRCDSVRRNESIFAVT